MTARIVRVGKPGTVSPPPYPQIVYPLAHASIGYAYVLSLARWVLPFGLRWFLFGLFAFLVVVTVKETYWDPAHEEGQPFVPEGEVDLLSYIAGIGFALTLLLV